MDMFATFHNMHLSQFMSPILEPRALAIDALSQDWQGRSMYFFPPFPLFNKVIQKLRTTQEGEVIPIAPWWPFQPWFPHLLRPPVHHSVPPGPTVTTGVCLRWQVVPPARLEALMQHYQAAGFSKEVSRLAASRRKPSTNRMYNRQQVASLLSRTGNAAAVQAKNISDMITSTKA